MAKYTTYKNHKPTTITGLEKIPKHWEIKQVRYLLLDGQEGIKIGPFGSALKLEDMVEVGYKVYGQENVIKKNFSLGKRWISENKFKAMQVYRIHAGDILITMMGTSGKCEIVPDDCQTGIIDSHLIRLGLKKEKMLPRFFKLLIDGTLEIEYQVKVQGKGSIMHGLNSSIIKNLELPLPPLLEQNDILRFLDHETAQIDTLIKKQQTLIQLLKEKRQAVISHAVTKGLNPDAPMKDSGVEWLGEVPVHWEIMAISKLTQKITNGYVGPTRDILVPKGVPYIQATHIKRGNVNFDDAYFVREEWSKKHSKSILKEQDVLVVQTGAGTGDIGLVTSEEAGYNCHALIILQPKANLILGGFLSFTLQSDYGYAILYSIRTGGMHPHLNCGEVKYVKVSVPPIDEQQEIIAYIERMKSKFNDLINNAEQAIQLMQERRTALISAAVTGKIDVRGWVAPE